jgi:hypothetical protein
VLPEPSGTASAPADPGGTFVNVSAVALVLSQPPMVLKPSRVADLPYTPTHRDLKAATAADIATSAALDAAEAEATTPGQEQ